MRFLTRRSPYKLHFPKTLIAIVEIASNASDVFDKKAIMPHKPEPRTKTHYCNLRSLVQNKRSLIKKRQPQNARGSKQKTSDKKEAIPKRKGSKRKTSDEKRGNPKTQGAQNERAPMKKEATEERKRLKIRDLR
jgi:hypothetical protein